MPRRQACRLSTEAAGLNDYGASARVLALLPLDVDRRAAMNEVERDGRRFALKTLRNLVRAEHLGPCAAAAVRGIVEIKFCFGHEQHFLVSPMVAADLAPVAVTI